MNVTFRLRFHTRPGQSLWLVGSQPLPTEPIALRYRDEESWEVTVPLTPHLAKTRLNYSYVLREADDSRIMDWGQARSLVSANFEGNELLVMDSWNDAGDFANAFATAPFKKVLLAQNLTAVDVPRPEKPTHTFRVKFPLLALGQTLCLLGEDPLLGSWNEAEPLLLSRSSCDDYFSVSLDLGKAAFPLVYKYGIFHVEEKRFARFEEGDNRTLPEANTEGEYTVIDDGFVRLPADTWHGAGVAVPVFSLRSEKGFGVGEFTDLKALTDWGKKVGLKLIQLLPVNDTSATGTWKDSYPYAAISAFALHPLYLNLAAVVSAKTRPWLQTLEPERQKLNALEVVDYEAVMSAKQGFLKKIFPVESAATFSTEEFKTFLAMNRYWLVPYAVFCFLRDKFGTADFNQWPEHRYYDAEKIEALARENHEAAFHYFVQFHLHRQLQDATAYAHRAGLIVKGDIPIGVYRHGADTWQQPGLFHLNKQAGAPPDAFSLKGQNWGFPTYRWTAMAANGFVWWKQRFAQMSGYFDAFRVDHILGFFRIWSCPLDAVEGILGHFDPAIPVDPSEFSLRQIPFDRARLTRPFINDAVLSEMFGEQAGLVRRQYLLATGDGHYALKPELATQRQVEKIFAGRSENKTNRRLRQGLYDLISNVIMLEVEGKFHFRFAMEDTLSFAHLHLEVQGSLRELYIDYFFRRQDDFWKHEALEKLPALKRVTDMLICGEDLGLVPDCVPEVMRDLGFLTLEIQRMPKRMGLDFSRPAEAPYLSVVTPSTHDMSTIRGWWEEDREMTQSFYGQELGLPGDAPAEATPEVVEAVVRQHLASPALWSIFQLQDLLGMDGRLRRKNVNDERINVPAIPTFYWRYRLHLTLEELQAAQEFNTHLTEMLRTYAR